MFWLNLQLAWDLYHVTNSATANEIKKISIYSGVIPAEAGIYWLFSIIQKSNWIPDRSIREWRVVFTAHFEAPRFTWVITFRNTKLMIKKDNPSKYKQNKDMLWISIFEFTVCLVFRYSIFGFELMNFYPIFWKELMLIRKKPWRFLASSLVMPALYLITFGWGLRHPPGAGSLSKCLTLGLGRMPKFSHGESDKKLMLNLPLTAYNFPLCPPCPLW